MSYRPHSFVNINPSNPQAVGCCDRCSLWYNLKDLKWQYDWRGDQLVNIRLRVCYKCMDVPYQGRRPLRLPPDPIPVKDPRPILNAQAEQNVPPVEYWDEPGLLWDDGQSDWEVP